MSDDDEITVKLAEDGSVTIPEEIREELGWEPGTELTLTVERGGVRLYSFGAAVRSLQKLVRQYVPEGVSLVDELLADRRREADAE
jgi:AbrB family looped-hinge helix DNA binding protein